MDEWLEDLLVFKKGKLLGLSMHDDPLDGCLINARNSCWKSWGKHDNLRTLDCQRDSCSVSALEVQPKASTCTLKGSFTSRLIVRSRSCLNTIRS